MLQPHVKVIVEGIPAQELEERPHSGQITRDAVEVVPPLQSEEVAVLDQVAFMPKAFISAYVILCQRPRSP